MNAILTIVLFFYIIQEYDLTEGIMRRKSNTTSHNILQQRNASNISLNIDKSKILKLNRKRLTIIYKDVFINENLTSVKVIDLKKNRIRLIMSEVFMSKDGFENITVIDFSFNKIKYILVGHLKGLINIQNISFSNNNIKYIEADALNENIFMVELLLRHNRIKTFPEKLFKVHKHFKVLDVGYNLMYELSGFKYSKCKIEIISVENNLMKLNNLKSLRFIKRLNLNYNLIYKIDMFTFDNNRKIKILSLKGNNLNVIKLGSLDPMTKIIWLSIANNSLDVIPDFLFRKNSHIKNLYLNNNHLRVLKANTFSGITYSLILLNLDHNYISWIEKNTFENFVSLKYLYMSGNDLKHINEKTYSVLKSIVEIHFADNPIICHCALTMLMQKNDRSIKAFVDHKNGVLECIHNSQKYTIAESANKVPCAKIKLPLMNGIVMLAGSISIIIWLIVIMYYYFRDITWSSAEIGIKRMLGLHRATNDMIYMQVDKENKKIGAPKIHRRSLDPTQFVEDIGFTSFPINNPQVEIADTHIQDIEVKAYKHPVAGDKGHVKEPDDTTHDTRIEGNTLQPSNDHNNQTDKTRYDAEFEKNQRNRRNSRYIHKKQMLKPLNKVISGRMMNRINQVNIVDTIRSKDKENKNKRYKKFPDRI